MSNHSFFSLLILLLLFTISASSAHDEPFTSTSGDTNNVYTLKVSTLENTNLDNLLSFAYYQKTCPHFESILHNKLKQWIQNDYTLAAALMRLHFHDCSVRGCDGSILLNHEGSERRAKASKTLRGFEVIDDIKEELEKHCPKTVSCADILTAVSRDATVQLGGPYWSVPYGRKDGFFSIANEADQLVPMGHENITSLLEFIQSKGMNVLDLVVLSGAHTIGRASCGSIQNRLYSYEGTGKPDPSMNPKYLNFLQRKCRWASETSPIVSALASVPYIFKHQFAVSMAKLGNVGVLTGQDEGEIRTNCSFVN
ncbi:hypothetical protein PIB30_047033, partial [Stylosanthes scabra]|nr:hypothetical protein [Stylosanthes scabra]